MHVLGSEKFKVFVLHQQRILLMDRHLDNSVDLVGLQLFVDNKGNSIISLVLLGH